MYFPVMVGTHARHVLRRIHAALIQRLNVVDLHKGETTYVDEHFVATIWHFARELRTDQSAGDRRGCCGDPSDGSS